MYRGDVLRQSTRHDVAENRSCVGKWRQEERNAWDRKMHDVGRVKAMLAAAGKTLQVKEVEAFFCTARCVLLLAVVYSSVFTLVPFFFGMWRLTRIRQALTFIPASSYLLSPAYGQ